jgi:hypothetical protein
MDSKDVLTMSWSFSMAEGNLSGFREPIHCKDDGVAIRWRKPSDKVQGDVGPGAMRNREWLKEASRSLPRSLILSTYHACSDEG